MEDISDSPKEKSRLRDFFLHKKIEDGEMVEQEILSMVNEGHENGVLESSEAKMINNIFEFGDKEASDICTKRNDIDSLDNKMLLSCALKHMLDSSYSRYPVYEDTIDQIVGILYLKDACRVHAANEELDKPIGEIGGLIRKAMIIPETMNIDDLFKTMQQEKTQMAVVIDEYGQTTGLVSMEDILEEIVGNIMDEYDVEKKHIRKKRGTSEEYIVDGSTLIEDMENTMNISIEKGEYETLNGFMISQMDRLPEKDEKFSTICNGYEYKILSVDNRMVTKVSVRKINSQREDTK